MPDLPELKLQPIPNKAIVPEEGERYEQLDPKPVARRDLPKDFQESVQMGWKDYLIHNTMFDYDFATAIRPFSAYMWSDQIEDEQPGWRAIAKKYAEKGLILNSIWGIRHGMDFFNGTGEAVVPEETHRFLLDIFGPRFLGWENGEQDGEYCAQYVFGSYEWPEQSPDRSRKEAYGDFVRFSRDTLDALFHHHVVSIGSLGFCHYYGEMGHRMIGLELGTGLQSSIMRCAFLRGAARQYDLLTHAHISMFMPSIEQKPDFYNTKCFPRNSPGIKVEFMFGHPDGGVPTHLAKRLWFAGYMYGLSLCGTEGGLFYDDMCALPKEFSTIEAEGIRPEIPVKGEDSWVGDIKGAMKKQNVQRGHDLEANLTPFGREYRKWVWTTRTRPDRGVQYSPVALVLDFHHGWNPPIHKGMGQGHPEKVWGNIDYTLGDFQIDQFFHWIFPNYGEYAYAINGRGCLTPTPLGDSFDVILSNASMDVLNKYQVAVLLGGMPDDEDFAANVESFVRAGRTVVLCTRQLRGTLANLAGLRVKETDAKGTGSKSLVTGKSYKEAEYIYDKVESDGAEVLAVNDAGDPLVCVNRVGEGSVYVVTPVFWATGERPDYVWHKRDDLPWDMNYRNDYIRGRPFPPPNFLKVVQEIVGSVIESTSLIKVKGRPIQWIVNVTDDPRKLLVTLVNNGEVTWEGTVKVKGQKIESCLEWLSSGEAMIKKGRLKAAVPATDVRIYELTCEESFLEFA